MLGKARLVGVSDLKPPDPLNILNRLALSTGKAARLCGVTRRQLGYWLAQGALGGSVLQNGRRARYGWPTLARILALKQIRDRGKGVRRAKQVLEQMAQVGTVPSSDWSQAQRMDFLARQAQRLEAVSARMRALALNGRSGSAGPRCATGVRVPLNSQDSVPRGEDLLRLSEWLAASRQGWAAELSSDRAPSSDVERCQRIGLFLDLLEASLTAMMPAGQCDPDVRRRQLPHRN
jgi:DNA-binding transcriptional MerR regulator